MGYGHYTQRHQVPVFASADDDEGTDDDADESDADSNADAGHRLLIQVVEVIRKRYGRGNIVRLSCDLLRKESFTL